MNWKPMLAVNTKPDKVKLPSYGSIKLEGVRGCFTPDGLKTRPLKKFGNPWIELKFEAIVNFCEEHNVIIEGEFYKHGMDFSEISSICRRRHHPDTDDMEFYIFDMLDLDHDHEDFTTRVQMMQNLPKLLDCKDMFIIHQHLHHSAESIAESYFSALDCGYEGYVLKNPDQSYKYGRSTHNEQKFLRIKAEETYDGIVLEIVERMENLVESERNELGMMSKRQDKDMKAHTGMAAVAVTKCADFPETIRVTLSRGLTDADRKDIWTEREDKVGKNIRFVGIPVKGMLPRAPRFDAWRTDLD